MFLVALTGGIASGKSLVSARLEELGAVIVDADVLAREVVEPGTPALAEISEVFGERMIAPDGSLDRAALGAVVFSDPTQREKLNGITHPAVWARARELFEETEERFPDAIVVYDVPLLAEAAENRPMAFDFVVVVEAPVETRIARMVENRGMTQDEAEARIASQASDAERRALADVVVDNGGDRASTLEQVDALWDRVIRDARRSRAR